MHLDEVTFDEAGANADKSKEPPPARRKAAGAGKPEDSGE